MRYIGRELRKKRWVKKSLSLSLSLSRPLYLGQRHRERTSYAYHLRIRAHTSARNSNTVEHGPSNRACMVIECGLKSAG
jgi:hypothetical protein